MAEPFYLPFGEWLPDAPDLRNPGCTTADNVLPAPNGTWKPLKARAQVWTTTAATIRGAAQFRKNDGTKCIVFGADTMLGIHNGSTATQTTGLTSIGATEAWDFARFNDFIIAAGANNSPQYLTDIDTDTSWSALPGSPPTAKRVAKVDEFLMFGNVSGAPNRVQWGAYNAPTGSYTASRLTQAGSVDMRSDFGPVQRIVGGRFALIFQEFGVTRLNYVGPPVRWHDGGQPLVADRGCVAPFSVVSNGTLVAYLSQDGFRVNSRGMEDFPIGSDRVNGFFFDDIKSDDNFDIIGAVDWENNAFVWAYRQDGQDTYNRGIIWNWSLNRWSTMTQTLDWLVPYGSGLAAFAQPSSTADFQTFTGAPDTNTLATAEFQPVPGKRVFVSAARPIVTGAITNATGFLNATDNVNTEASRTTKNLGRDGRLPVRGEAQRFELSVSLGTTAWEDASGVEIEYQMAGER